MPTVRFDFRDGDEIVGVVRFEWVDGPKGEVSVDEEQTGPILLDGIERVMSEPATTMTPVDPPYPFPEHFYWLHPVLHDLAREYDLTLDFTGEKPEQPWDDDPDAVY